MFTAKEVDIASNRITTYTYNSEDVLPIYMRVPSQYVDLKLSTFYDFDMALNVENDTGGTERLYILQEIYDTERTYVRALTKTCEIILNQLVMWCPKSKKCIRSMFGELPAITKTHQIILEDLRTRPIAEVFTKFLPFLKLYTSYATHYPNGLKVHAKLMSCADFRKALIKIEEDPRLDGIKLHAFLIMPIQRIPRYILLVQALMGYTTNSNDMTNLYKVLTGMQSLTDRIQSCMSSYENGERLLQIQLSFGLEEHVLEPGRVLLKEGTLFKREINGGTTYQEVVMFLFNDVILYGTKKLSVGSLCKYDPSAMLALRHCIVTLDEIGGSMMIRCGNVGADFTAYSLAGVTEWYNEICDAIDNAIVLRNTLRKESFKQKALVFDRGFWQKNRDLIRNMLSSEKPSIMDRVFSKKTDLPKLEESDFLRGQWTTSTTASNRKRQIGTPKKEGKKLGGSPNSSSPTKRKRQDEGQQRLKPDDGRRFFFNDLFSSDVTFNKPVSRLSSGKASFVDSDEDDFVLTDEEDYVPQQMKIPIKRVASYDEEDRRPRSRGGYRRQVASEPRRQLGVADIRKLSYQQRTLEPFNMVSDDDDDDDIEVKVKGERTRPRPWWETESAPPVMRNHKPSIIDSVRNNCSIM